MELKCARCLAGMCDHAACRTSDLGVIAATYVNGTACCGDCAGVLLELVLYPMQVGHTVQWAGGRGVKTESGMVVSGPQPWSESSSPHVIIHEHSSGDYCPPTCPGYGHYGGEYHQSDGGNET